MNEQRCVYKIIECRPETQVRSQVTDHIYHSDYKNYAVF